jgi:hypothetical protein
MLWSYAFSHFYTDWSKGRVRPALKEVVRPLLEVRGAPERTFIGIGAQREEGDVLTPSGCNPKP